MFVEVVLSFKKQPPWKAMQMCRRMGSATHAAMLLCHTKLHHGQLKNWRPALLLNQASAAGAPSSQFAL